MIAIERLVKTRGGMRVLDEVSIARDDGGVTALVGAPLFILMASRMFK